MWDVGRSASTDVLFGTSSLVGAPDEVFGTHKVRGADVAGLAVHIGARVAAAAGPGEVLVSAAVPPLVVGSGIAFADRGEHELKGVPGIWKLFAVAN
jgi:class 3 adenylate cyclase